MATKKDIFIIITIICIILFTFVYNFFNRKQLSLETGDFQSTPQQTNVIQDDLANNEITDAYILVYISGEVNNPDVYELDKDARIKDLVNKAGGFTESADKNNVNLSKKLFDEDHIHIGNINMTDDNNMTEQSSSNNGLVNINTGTLEELKTLPNIGDGIGSNIISYREENNGFKNIEELKEVDRIGEKTFEKLKDLVCL